MTDAHLKTRNQVADLSSFNEELYGVQNVREGVRNAYAYFVLQLYSTPIPSGRTLQFGFHAQYRPGTATTCSESLAQLNVPLVIVRLKASVHPAAHSTKTLMTLCGETTNG